jgi:hypothetical protein
MDLRYKIVAFMQENEMFEENDHNYKFFELIRMILKNLDQ